mmetsp:Transcript_31318/g.78601  ORF Transcript_31318/g.78601 Transcript_31318/m.78601 type:complete len:231 (-) Transcript_31318:261-953(-)
MILRDSRALALKSLGDGKPYPRALAHPPRTPPHCPLCPPPRRRPPSRRTFQVRVHEVTGLPRKPRCSSSMSTRPLMRWRRRVQPTCSRCSPPSPSRLWTVLRATPWATRCSTHICEGSHLAAPMYCHAWTSCWCCAFGCRSLSTTNHACPSPCTRWPGGSVSCGCAPLAATSSTTTSAATSSEGWTKGTTSPICSMSCKRHWRSGREPHSLHWCWTTQASSAACGHNGRP